MNCLPGDGTFVRYLSYLVLTGDFGWTSRNSISLSSSSVLRSLYFCFLFLKHDSFLWFCKHRYTSLCNSSESQQPQASAIYLSAKNLNLSQGKNHKPLQFIWVQKPQESAICLIATTTRLCNSSELKTTRSAIHPSATTTRLCNASECNTHNPQWFIWVQQPQTFAIHLASTYKPLQLIWVQPSHFSAIHLREKTKSHWNSSECNNYKPLPFIRVQKPQASEIHLNASNH